MGYVKWFADDDVLDWIDAETAKAKASARANGERPPSRSGVLNMKVRALMGTSRATDYGDIRQLCKSLLKRVDQAADVCEALEAALPD